MFLGDTRQAQGSNTVAARQMTAVRAGLRRGGVGRAAMGLAKNLDLYISRVVSNGCERSSSQAGTGWRGGQSNLVA